MVNLSPAQAAVAKLMTDVCALRRNPGGVDDDVLNPNPGSLDLGTAAPAPYYTGPCMFRVSPVDVDNGIDSSVSVPLEVDARDDDFVEILEARDTTMVGHWFRVDQVRGGTFAVSRKLVTKEVANPWPVAVRF